MTTKLQKSLEIVYAKKAGELLNETWVVKPSPNEVSWPDLIVSTGIGEFGLEVREVYLDESHNGSLKKARESENRRLVGNLASSYYLTSRPSVKVDFLGDVSRREQILNVLVKETAQMSALERKRVKPYDDCVLFILRLPDHLGKYRRWRYVSDAVGWVSCIDKGVLDRAIAKKARKLSKYTECIPDVRLLLVSDRMYNSGKAFLMGCVACDPHGFKTVYYLSYPDTVWVIGS